MSADAMKNLSEVDARNLVEDLINHLQLTDQQVNEIKALMSSSGGSFIEAATSLHLLTPEQLNDLMKKALALQDEKPSIIEAARRKVLGRRSAVLEMREPEEKCTPTSRLTIAHDPYSERSEKLRGLRTELTLRFGAGSKAVMLAIVSPAHGEGRTQLAAELAIAFAQLERRTLLVDADLRSPGLHKLFQCSNDVGLSQAIHDETEPHLFGVTGLPQLHLLTAGPSPSNPIELLSTKRFEHLVGNWRHTYDFVIIDTPPVATYADALTVSTLVKRVLLTTRAGNTSIKDGKEMLRRLSITHSEILGAVVNHF
jgi:receptor protein-tyrosine kinase